VHLALGAKIAGFRNAKLQELSGLARANFPVSKLLNAKVSGNSSAACIHRATPRRSAV
jgi:hypothetical protein